MRDLLFVMNKRCIALNCYSLVGLRAPVLWHQENSPCLVPPARQENSPRGRWYYIPYESYTVRSIQRRECQAPHGDSTFTRGYPPGSAKTLLTPPPGSGHRPEARGGSEGSPPRGFLLAHMNESFTSLEPSALSSFDLSERRRLYNYCPTNAGSVSGHGGV